MPLCIVITTTACLPQGTYVFQYDEGYLEAVMKPNKRGNMCYKGDKNQVMIPIPSLMDHVVEVSHKGCVEFYMHNGELHKRGKIWIP